MSTQKLIAISDLAKTTNLEDFYGANQPLRASIKGESLIFDYIFHPKESESLIIFLPSAQEPPRKQQPYFYRWTYSLFLSEDILCVADPTAYLDEAILGGWLLGTRDCWALEEIIGHIRSLVEQKKYKNIIFSGSSMGGFNALQAATFAESQWGNEIRVRFIAENPQLSLTRYQYSLDLLAKTIWNTQNLKAIPRDQLSRIEVIELMEELNVIPKGYVVFKESDDHHYKIQKPILDAFLAKKNSQAIQCSTIAYQEDDSGHTPISLKHFQDLVRLATEKTT